MKHKRITDAELKRIYLKMEPTGCDDWPDCFKQMRAVLAASTFKGAVAILEHAGWGLPMECAREIRGNKEKTCPTCHGTGVIE